MAETVSSGYGQVYHTQMWPHWKMVVSRMSLIIR